ncbi:GroES-like protein [Hortaea werneckii]|nr:GroES-like protein [Hortaea werneckii]KAI7014699.1 GroES-like protein [Hortaea werneckii]KAI7667112.1 GroES-like protein [Hortaea werneckii]
MSSTTVIERKPKNLAVHTNPEHSLHLVESDIPEPGPDDCLIHVRATGICGSDVHFWKHGHIGDMVVVGENGLGHESAGSVVKVGSNVTDFKEDIFFSTPPVHGTLRRYHVHPAAWLHKLPEETTFEEGSLLEPLSVALAGIDRSNLRLGDPLVICGAGPIGLVSLLAAHAAGAAPIVITDMDSSRLERAKQFVPRVRTVQVDRDQDAKEIGARITEALGTKAKLVLECTGVESSIHAGIYISW